MARRVVITGVGMVTPVGITADESWTALINGKVGVARIPAWEEIRFADDKPLPVTVGAEVKGFAGEDWIEPKKDVRRMDIFLQFAMAAAHQAWTQSGLPPKLDDETGDRAGSIIGVGLGGIQTIVHAWQVLETKGPRRVSPFFIPGIVGNMAPGYAAIRYNLRSANWAPASACSSGGHGIGEAAMHIMHDRADIMLAGGAEAGMHPITVAGFAAMHAMCASHNDNPQSASRPFDRTRDGFVLGEGAGIVILESLDHARARNAKIHAEIVGYGSTADAFRVTDIHEEARGALATMRIALAEAGLTTDDIDYISAHGTGTSENDKIETLAIRRMFGDRAKSVPISSIKSMTGHLIAAAGVVELITCVLAIRDDIIPPTINYEHADPQCDLDYVPNTARKATVRTALSNSFGFGGQNDTLIVTACDAIT